MEDVNIEKTKYLLKVTHKLFSSRTGMLNVNGNYHNLNTDPNCRACGKKTETQEHIVRECLALLNDKKRQNNRNKHI